MALLARARASLSAGTDVSRVVGLHAHLGSGIETVDHWRRVVDELGGFARRIGSVEVVDIGGGLPIPYSDDDEPFDDGEPLDDLPDDVTEQERAEIERFDLNRYR